MAYNPFNIFRRNQRAIFAVLTVFIMIMFTLSSGVVGGDFFDWFPQWLGRKSRKGEEVCKIDGSKVTEGELNQLRFQRVMANRFMALAAQQSLFYIGQHEDEQLRQVTDPEMRLLLSEGPRAQREVSEPQFQMLRQFNLERAVQTERIARDYAAIPTNPKAPAAAKEVVRARLWYMTLQTQLMYGGGEHYFINAPNRSQRDLLNFLLWQKKADQLGIQFTDSDISRLIQYEFFGFFRSDVEIRKQLQQSFPEFNIEQCLAAIGEEFRVRTAQVSALGPGWHGRPDKTAGSAPVFHPAYELFDFYREQCSPTTYEVIAVPGANFLDQVIGEPTEAELKKLYDEYQNVEYDPALERPGFKIPRKVKLQWASATGTEPYYLKKAEEKLKNDELRRAVSVLGAIQLLGGSSIAIPPVARPLVVDSLAEQYAREVEARHRMQLEVWSRTAAEKREFDPTGHDENRLLDTSVVRAPNLVAAAGGLTGGQLTLGGPLPGLVLLDAAAAAMERRDRIKVGMPLFLGTVPGPSLLATAVGAEAAARTMLPKPLPLDAVRAELLKTSASATAKQLMRDDQAKFRDTLNALGGNGFFDRLAAGAYLAGLVAERGWQRGESTGLRDEWTLEEDPGLAPLKAALPGSVHGDLPVRFGERFFWTRNPRDGSKVAATGTYSPEYYPNAPSGFESPEAKPDPKFLVWRTEETAAKAPSSIGQVRDAVKAAWKRIKARELAKARAESLARAIQSTPADSADLVNQNVTELVGRLKAEFPDPKAQERVKTFLLRDVAPLTQPDRGNPMAMFSGMQRFTLSPTNNIPYPTPEMSKALLDHRTDPAKTTFVLADAPKDTYYVVRVVQRNEKTADDFRRDVYQGFIAPARDAVLRVHAAEAQRKAYESVMGLLKAEFKYEETEDQKKRLDENEKRGGDLQ